MRTAGLVGLVAGVLGALSAVVMLAWPPQSAPHLLAYPFTPAGFQVAQGWFFVQHLGLLVAAVALARSAALARSRIGRLGAWLAVAGIITLAASELVALPCATADADVANNGPMGTLYGLATALIGLGLTIAGVAVARAHVWTGWRRWVPLVVGVAAFVIVMPGVFGGFVSAGSRSVPGCCSSPPSAGP